MEEQIRIDKRLFEAGLQCAKRLYLHYHEPTEEPEPSEHRQELIEIGGRLVQLASEAFPKSLDLSDKPIEEAAAATAEFLERGTPGVVFHAGFLAAGVEARVDVLLIPAPGQIDIFEVKAGTTIKPRHLQDVALQLHAIETSGHHVHGATILHLDPRYRHEGGTTYPPQKLFKSVDVTARSRRQLERMRGRIASFSATLADPGTLDLPTGTWCRNPLPCDYLPRCIEEGPEHPLVQLPQLTTGLLTKLHEQGVESIDQIEVQQKGLSALQRRVVRSIESGELEVEPFVSDELWDVDWPIAFVHVGWHLEVLPRFAGTGPWHKLPFAWSAVVVDSPDATPKVFNHVNTTADDPREPTLDSLAAVVKTAGTLVVYDRTFEDRLRDLLEAGAPGKSSVRALLQMHLLELGALAYHGVYHQEFEGRFDLWSVHDIATASRESELGDPVPGWTEATDVVISSDTDAQAAYKRLLNRRTRGTTRDKLGTQLTAWSKRSAAALFRLYRVLRGEQPAPGEKPGAEPAATSAETPPDADRATE